ncbi:MAG: DUF192 domain-containing protein [bacterium]|nr:DUF192 domain-containing protein [bacterium]
MKQLFAAVFLFVALVLVLLVLGSTDRPPARTNEVAIGDARVEVAVARTPAEQARGLSGVESLGDGEGMLFVFEVSGRHAFWMKGMKISIDIIWLDEQGAVVGIEENASPSSYRSDNDAETFSPAQDARYVLEVRAGFAEAHGVEIGDKAQFSLAAPSS